MTDEGRVIATKVEVGEVKRAQKVGVEIGVEIEIFNENVAPRMRNKRQ